MFLGVTTSLVILQILWSGTTCTIQILPDVPLSCPSGWTISDVHCHKVFTNPVTWLNANSICKRDGGHLVQPRDELANSDIGGLVASQNVGEYWIGLLVQGVKNVSSRSIQQSQLLQNVHGVNMSNMEWWEARWADGTDATLFEAFWDMSQPNTTAGDCVYTTKTQGGMYRWGVDSCQTKKAFVCQRPTCSQGAFHCHDGTCVNQKYVCDGEASCQDGSDEMDCPGQCRYIVRGGNGKIQSPNYPFEYGDNTKCSWVIEGPQGSNIRLQFLEFNTEKHDDLVTLLVGGRTPLTSTFVTQLSGEMTGHSVTYSSYNNFFTVVFSSDIGVNGRGFQANWTAVTTLESSSVQNVIARSSYQELTSPLYNQDYLCGEDVFWVFKPEHARNIITIKPSDTDIQDGDLLIIRDGTNIYGPILGVYTSTGGPDYIISTCGLHVTYSTLSKYRSERKRGFKLLYREGCDITVTEEKGVIFSPGYGVVNYENYQNCSWTIDLPVSRRVTVIFDDSFDVEEGYDYLQLYEGVDSSGPPLHPGMGFTGTTAPLPVSSNSGKMFINLKTDSIGSRKGYQGKFSIGCPVPNFNQYTIVTPSIVHYDFGVVFNVSCQTGYEFTSEELLRSDGTSIDYITVECLYGGSWNVRRIPQCSPKYCGQPPSVVNGYISTSTGAVYTSTVKYKCMDGFTTSGSDVISCKADGSWDSPPSCINVNCPLPPGISDGIYTIQEGTGSDFASSLLYSCNTGYQISGAPILFCLPNGTWSAPGPTCIKLQCYVPTLTNGHITMSGRGNVSGSYVNYQDQVQLTCNGGYQASDSSFLVCSGQQTLHVTGSPSVLADQLTCIDIDECSRTHGCNVTTEDCKNTEGSYTCECKTGFYHNLTTTACEDADECESNNGGCDAECINTLGSYTCGCSALTGHTLYITNGTENLYIPSTETGGRVGDKYHIGHSCVKVSCSIPPTLQNGFILNRQLYYHYGDEILYRCNHGYMLQGNRKLQCQSTGLWDYSFPLCQVASCPQDDSSFLSGLLNPPILSTTSDVPYGSSLELRCSVPGIGTFVKRRYCRYNPFTQQYRLQGDQYECGVIDCGTPENLPGSFTTYTPGQANYYGNQFTVTCQDFYRLHGNSSQGDNIVKCSSNGYWDYGNIRCLPVQCPGIGSPLGGQQRGSGYELGSTRTFICDRPGYTLSDVYPVECVASQDNATLVWNGTVPSCLDTTDPVITGCPAPVLVIRQYSIAWTGEVTASDNSGRLANFTIDPPDFRPYDPVIQNISVVYTATDFAGNQASCSVYVRIKDEEPPTIQCPASYTAYVQSESDASVISIPPSVFVTNDNNMVYSFTYSPREVNVSLATIDDVYTITGQVTDMEGNTASCQYQIDVRAVTCLPAYLNRPVNGNLTCEAKVNSTGYECQARCDQGYYFYDTYPNEVFVTECDNDGNWTLPYVPSCVASLPSSYKQTHRLQYRSPLNNTLLSSTCVATYRNTIGGILSSVSQSLTGLCRSLGQAFQKNVTVPSSGISVTEEDVNGFWFNMDYTVGFEPSGLRENDLCVRVVRSAFLQMTSDIAAITSMSGIPGCPDVEATYNVTVVDREECQSDLNTRISNGQTVCLECPPGSFYNRTTTSCESCPIGTFNHLQGASSCTRCPPGTSTYTTGNTRGGKCFFQCLGGQLTSESGLPLCTECSGNTYRSSVDMCTSCGAGKKYMPRDTCRTGPCLYTKIPNTLNNGYHTAYSGSISECQDFCENLVNATFLECVGFSYRRTLGICFCHFEEGAATVTDLEYDFYRRTCPVLTLEDCYCSQECSAGFASYDGYQPCIQCPQHYYSNGVRSRSCTECPQGTMTSSAGSSSSSDCLQAGPILCQPGQCKNNGTCQIVGHDYVCDCTQGYTGRNCETMIDYCASQPCYYGGTCVNLPSSFLCQCPTGITGSQCENEPNNCRPDTCKNGGVCQDLVLSYTCSCLPGFQGTNCDITTPICNTQPCQNGATCVPIDNIRRTCQCAPGYEGRDCQIDIDECASSPCINGGTCRDGVNTYTCECPPQYTGSTCETLLETCAMRNCGNADSCYEDHNTGRSLCICQPGYTLATKCMYKDFPDRQPIGPSNTVYLNMELANCITLCNGYQQGGSRCKAFLYRGDKSCQIYTTQVDNLVVQTGVTYYKRYCMPIYDDYDTMTFNIDDPVSDQLENETRQLIMLNNLDVCGSTIPLSATCTTVNNNIDHSNTSDILRTDCTSDGLACLSSDQPSRRDCEDYRVSFKCAISRVFSGQDCQLIDYCTMYTPCLRGGTCSNVEGGYHCTCPPGYGGSVCQHDLDNCLSSPCYNGGTCTDRLNAFSCQCLPGFEGPDCSQDKNECLLNVCDAVGTAFCNNTIGSYYCECLPGYTGASCSFNINECHSSPCYHGGSCEDKINGYICTCPDGWTGNRCQTIVQYCTDVSNPCLNSAPCKNLFNDYYCRCPASTYGRLCQSLSDICVRANPCLNQGVCATDNHGNMTCTCSQDCYGDGCQLIRDYRCSSNSCSNHGSCHVIAGGTSCDCNPGYTGQQCQTNIDECSSSPCTSSASCIDGINQYYCRCPVGKALPTCTQDNNRDYDLCFTRSQYNPSYAALPYGIPINPNTFSLSFWVRYRQVGGHGAYFTMFGQSLNGWPEQRQELFSLNDRGLQLHTMGSTVLHSFTYLTVNDGKWHFMTLTWSSSSRRLEVVLDTIREIDTQDNNYSFNMTQYIWPVLGNKESGLSGFDGCLSQINVYGRVLDFVQEVPQMYYDGFSTGNHGDKLQWAEFELAGYVEKVQPSTIKDTISINQLGSSRPVIKSCPTNLYTPAFYIWNDPVFEGATSIRTNQRKGGQFSRGRHTVTYEARNSANNTALCHFKIYISKDNCSGIMDPVGGGNQVCYLQGFPFTACHASCPASNYTLSQSAPVYYTCGPMGRWNSHDDDECPFQYPPCGVITREANVDISIKLVYDISTTVCTQVRTAMKLEAQKRLSQLNTQWDLGICMGQNCSDVIVNVACMSFVNISSTTEVDFVVKDVRPSLSNGNETLTPDEILTRNILDEGGFNFGEIIPRGAPDYHRFVLVVNRVCPSGQILKDLQCVYCGMGTYYNSTSDTCQSCDKGQYQDREDGALSCTACPSGETTQCTGATSLGDCYTICSTGSFYNRTSSQCELCGIGSYQNRTGRLSCIPCPFGKTTRQTGSVNENVCYEECKSGYELSSGGVCKACDIGYYRTEGVSLTCQPCPVGYITSGTATTSVSHCDVVACVPGQYRTQQNTCQDCPLSTYQDEKWQNSCKPCDISYRTDQTGSTSKAQCKFFCASGYEIQGGVCVPCEIGKYKDNNDGFYLPCQLCPARKTTPTNTSTSVTDCSILICPAGYKADQSNTLCEKCPVGQYQPQENQVSCLPCPTGTSTLTDGAAASTDCIEFCASGYEKGSSGCTECAVGFYKDNNDGVFGTCQACPVNFVTPSTGATSQSQCTVRSCSEGYKITGSNAGCDPCPLGEYQPNKYQTSCIPCPAGTSTRQTASIQLTQCEAFCPSGEEKDVTGNCTKCDIGYYKDNNNGVFGSCQLCPLQYITTNQGSISASDCNVGNCTAGFYTKGSQCLPCDKGTYQPDKWQPSCVSCPVDMTTTAQGAINITECFLSCKPGYEAVSGACQKCPVGFYNPQQGANSCLKCPVNYITAGTGAVSMSDCTVADCGPGTFLQAGSNLCQQCPYSQYQPNKWQSRCVQCPTNTTTYTLGAKLLSECLLDCASGYGYNSSANQCQACPRGYYRDKSVLSQSECLICPISFITVEGRLGTSVSSCTIANCSMPGEYRDTGDNVCKPCPLGTYQDRKWQESCTPCNTGYTTGNTSSVTVTQCIRDCDSGYEEVSDQCVACGQGFYRNKSMSLTCQPCPQGFTTPSTAASDEAQCTLPTCSSGQYYVSARSQCEPCPQGMYQPLQYQRACVQCPNNKYTRQPGAVASSECVSFCGVDLDNCSPDAVCTDKSTHPGYQCRCKTGWSGNGTVCTHPCDIPNYCNNRGQCMRRTDSICVCQDMYTGIRCEIRRDAQTQSDNLAEVATGATIGGVVFILVVVLISVAICSCNRQEGKRRHGRSGKARLKYPISRQPSFVGPTVTKANLLDYTQSSINPYGYGGLSLPHNNSFIYPEPLHDASFLTAPNSHLSVSRTSDESVYIANDKDEVF